MYAIIETGGKQYRVSQGDVIKVEKLNANVGDVVEIDQVFAVGQAGDLKIGTPIVEGAKVLVKVEEQGRGKKLIIYKYKSKKNYRRKQGHRQSFTQVRVEEIRA
ncbi:50S ribosomal protein L21 [Heliophilum fasciatum]|uniref:Large ribosomal subunit protein bL21 n=1 Tax=Heliophilum fasciatum TaxID=35700 RepID=A0A4R2RV27_9FIRM|nr:50S ribosomal protein L21 [Heliophilum fasciatum]MCW2277123.1 large subunit ribosomal protein L21 [Heliophilum fasciatum]TCP68240.1 LSU ribosomal protein L21P [Heliophilum fasciatum]